MRKPVGVNNSFHSSLLWRVAHFSRRYNSSSFNVDPKTTRVRHFSRFSRSGPSQLSTSSLPEGIPLENIEHQRGAGPPMRVGSMDDHNLRLLHPCVFCKGGHHESVPRGT